MRPPVRYGQTGYIGWRMSERAAAAYAAGELPATAAARAFGFRRAQDVRDLFMWSSWHHVGKYATPINFYDINDQINHWRRISDVPTGLLRAVTRTARPWWVERIREMMRRNWLNPRRHYKRCDAVSRIVRNLVRLSGLDTARDPANSDIHIRWLNPVYAALNHVGTLVAKRRLSFSDALYIARHMHSTLTTCDDLLATASRYSTILGQWRSSGQPIRFDPVALPIVLAATDSAPTTPANNNTTT